MDSLVTAVRELFAFVTGAKPRFTAHGGSAAENLALQNIQVRATLISAEFIFIGLLGTVTDGAVIFIRPAPSMGTR